MSTLAPVRTNNPHGRPSSAQLADRLERARLRNVVLTDELTARKAEAISLVVGLLPLIALLTTAAREVGPREYQAAIAVAMRLRRYRAQNEDPEPDVPVVAAA